MSITLNINGENRSIDVASDTPLLWAIRDAIGLKGTKYGCGVGVCGACTVEVDGNAVRSCSVTVKDVEGSPITTIEGLSEDGLHPLQEAWIEEQVPQCGYCQPGMIMAAKVMLQSNPSPSEADIRSQITNVCRCGTYPRITRAIQRAARESG
ncbi:(2Fe-2S)-binding protein [Altererythrobacter sp. GH1-8]|uniref:(2Fe-2S)-binding protein n=1 Tax=Altererythrobacter sp. GH1-8 TaxID=3349333 RepID=UPI00374D4E0E